MCRTSGAVLILAVGALLTACAGRTVPESVLDTPQAHCQAGMQLLEEQRVEEARAEFEYALGLDDEYAPAYHGLGLVELAWGQGEEAERQFRRALSRDRTFAPAHVGLGRAFRMQEEYERAVDAFEDGIEANPRHAPAYDWLGRTQIDLRDFGAAVDAYARGISALPDDPDLNAGWQRTSEIQRATLGIPDRYVEIALSEAVDRAEMAVLLNEMLDLGRIFDPKRSPEAQRFRPPGQQEQPAERSAMATDVPSGHWARVQVENCVKYGAMDLMPDGSFRPTQVVSRQEMAMLVQRVLVVAWNDPSLRSKYFGSTSPFPDVPGTHFAFNAVALATGRGIMSGRPDGTFFPEGTIPGHEAILIVRNLKGALQP